MHSGDKEEFLKEFGEDYGYPNGPKSIDEIRATEFKRLENGQILYFFALDQKICFVFGYWEL